MTGNKNTPQDQERSPELTNEYTPPIDNPCDMLKHMLARGPKNQSQSSTSLGLSTDGELIATSGQTNSLEKDTYDLVSAYIACKEGYVGHPFNTDAYVDQKEHKQLWQDAVEKSGSLDKPKIHAERVHQRRLKIAQGKSECIIL